MKIELDLPEIEGFEYTGAYRTAEIGEYVLIHDHVIECQGHSYEYPILKKKEPKYKLLSHKQSIKDDDVIEYVEIKALKDLIKLAQTDIESMSNAQCEEWDSIVDLLN